MLQTSFRDLRPERGLRTLCLVDVKPPCSNLAGPLVPAKFFLGCEEACIKAIRGVLAGEATD